MKVTKILSLILVSITILVNLRADNRIILYLQNPPEQALNSAELELAKEQGIAKLEKIDTKTPSQVSKKLIKGELLKQLTPKTSGFMALYSGYIDYSDSNGLISFPLRHTSPKLYVIITPRIKLIDVKRQTISHQEFVTTPDNSTKIYLFEKKQDKNKQFFWAVSEQQIPANKRISPLSVVILSKPKNLHVFVGDFISNDSKHIIIPNNVYVVGNIANKKIILNALNNIRFFEPITTEEKKISDIIYQKMITNM